MLQAHDSLLPSHPLSAQNRPGSFALGLSDSGSAFGSLQGGPPCPTRDAPILCTDVYADVSILGILYAPANPIFYTEGSNEEMQSLFPRLAGTLHRCLAFLSTQRLKMSDLVNLSSAIPFQIQGPLNTTLLYSITSI